MLKWAECNSGPATVGSVVCTVYTSGQSFASYCLTYIDKIDKFIRWWSSTTLVYARVWSNELYYPLLKQLSSRYSKNKRTKKKMKLKVNTGQVMFIGEIYYY